MEGKIPPALADAVAAFERLTPAKPNVKVKKVFGQPAAFVNGNMFMGVFGGKVFVRLSEKDAQAAKEEHQMLPFEPMPGRPMRSYIVLPSKLLRSPSAARGWVKKSFDYAEKLPAKRPKGKPG